MAEAAFEMEKEEDCSRLRSALAAIRAISSNSAFTSCEKVVAGNREKQPGGKGQPAGVGMKRGMARKRNLMFSGSKAWADWCIKRDLWW
jgi:hypothetical protein